ncbi:uncharacterized protein ACLA_052930 [Aspergillus clavatus NRRL 1]|uniref:Uncharacterized protein n=1 Tax=Aspergillus clavatus (strain ATCC 1007 / CBS 513.65 / DSM 816 / NCTC 3887 / NRRL 1 / QM 1276 / 107) TaxID=344612 RepID=A1CIW5_ASPCL|nr:uncharacterized protein ACLA_052930 [Aspergillus clavatus NRRL 1]EAW10820.1 hypothetical protein ACLA_052930 [Aspergillus clavatus NRRL 1]
MSQQASILKRSEHAGSILRELFRRRASTNATAGLKTLSAVARMGGATSRVLNLALVNGAGRPTTMDLEIGSSAAAEMTAMPRTNAVLAANHQTDERHDKYNRHKLAALLFRPLLFPAFYLAIANLTMGMRLETLCLGQWIRVVGVRLYIMEAVAGSGLVERIVLRHCSILMSK